MRSSYGLGVGAVDLFSASYRCLSSRTAASSNFEARVSIRKVRAIQHGKGLIRLAILL